MEEVVLNESEQKLLRFFAQMLKPVATAAPMDKYRKTAGIGPTVFLAETKVQAEEHKVERKAERKMMDVNRAEPAAAVLVRPLPAVQQRKKRIRKSAMPRKSLFRCRRILTNRIYCVDRANVNG